MNISVYPATPLLEIKELLFVGFERDFNDNIQDFPYESKIYRFQIENDLKKVIQWLEERIESMDAFQPPYAVICNLHWLESSHFHLSRLIMAHPDLRYVPVICLTGKGGISDRSALLQEGVDDCYAVPVQWDMLEKRLEFLNQYKPSILENKVGRRQAFKRVYKTPVDKRIFDIIAASLGIASTFPLWILVAIAIRLESKGPVIYKSKRVGAGYRVFKFFKFRSMYADSERRLKELLHMNQYNDGQEQVFVKLYNDPRVTRVGRFIRKYSLDELPQLINVLKGDMSLVGNRPLPLYEAELLVRDESCERFLAPAGLTGLWQVSKRGRSNMSMTERIQLDISYSRQYSLWYDFNIIARTFYAIVQKENV